MTIICKITYFEKNEKKILYVKRLETAYKMNKKLKGEITILSNYGIKKK